MDYFDLAGGERAFANQAYIDPRISQTQTNTQGEVRHTQFQGKPCCGHRDGQQEHPGWVEYRYSLYDRKVY